MISHDNLGALSKNITEDILMPGGKVLSFLPSSHIASLSLDVFLGFIFGNSVYFTGKDALKGNLSFYLLEVKPTAFLGVPRVYEKI